MGGRGYLLALLEFGEEIGVGRRHIDGLLIGFESSGQVSKRQVRLGEPTMSLRELSISLEGGNTVLNALLITTPESGMLPVTFLPFQLQVAGCSVAVVGAIVRTEIYVCDYIPVPIARE